MRPTITRRRLLAAFLGGLALAPLASRRGRASHVVRIKNPMIRVHGMNDSHALIRVHRMGERTHKIKVHGINEKATRIRIHAFGDPQTARRRRKRKTLPLRVHAFGD